MTTLAICQLDLVTLACNSSKLLLQIKEHPGLPSEFQARLGYSVRPCFKQTAIKSSKSSLWFTRKRFPLQRLDG